jgi:curved DNA-binding protein CbpA
MRDSEIADHYQVLQLSPNADLETIQRVFRHLAKRFHPDNAETGDAQRFREIVEAFQVLSDPTARAAYDARWEEARRFRWRVFDQRTAMDDIDGDRRIRAAILSLLYTARRNDPTSPGMGDVHLEQLLGCPEAHLRFHLWYMKENGWIQRLDTGALAITAGGVDRVAEQGGPLRDAFFKLKPGNQDGGASEAA